MTITHIESGIKVECQMETAKQKTITFEFVTGDFDSEEISEEFVKEDLLPPQHIEIVREQLLDIDRQLKDDSTRIPIVHFPPEQLSSSSPNRDTSKKATLAASTSAPVQQPTAQTASAEAAPTGGNQSPAVVPNVPSDLPPLSVPSSPVKTASVPSADPEGEGEVRKSRFTILPLEASGNQTPEQAASQSPATTVPPTGQPQAGGQEVAAGSQNIGYHTQQSQGNSSTGITPESTIHQGNRPQGVVTDS